MLLTKIIPEPYSIFARIGIVLLVLSGAFVTGWIKRGQHDEDKVQTAIIKEQTRIIRVHDTQKVIDDTAVKDLQSKIAVLRKQKDDLQESIKQLPDTCSLSSEWVRTYNRSIQTYDASASTRIDASTRKVTTTSK